MIASAGPGRAGDWRSAYRRRHPGNYNFSPVAIKAKNNVMIRNLDLLGECMILSTLLAFS